MTPSRTGWQIYGPGAVAADGRQILPDPGVAIYEFTGAMSTPPPDCATNCPPGPDNGPRPGGGPGHGDPVDTGTGLFVLTKTDLALPDVVPLALARTYRPNDPAVRAFGIGTTHPYEGYLTSANGYLSVDLILPDGGRVHYVRTSPGTGFSGAAFAHTATPSVFYQSTIVWNAGANAWQLTLRDGRQSFFPANAPLQRIADRFGNTVTRVRGAANGVDSGPGSPDYGAPSEDQVGGPRREQLRRGPDRRSRRHLAALMALQRAPPLSPPGPRGVRGGMGEAAIEVGEKREERRRWRPRGW